MTSPRSGGKSSRIVLVVYEHNVKAVRWGIHSDQVLPTFSGAICIKSQTNGRNRETAHLEKNVHASVVLGKVYVVQATHKPQLATR